MCPRSRFAHLPLIVEFTKREFMEDFFKPTLSKVKEVENLHGETSCKGEMAVVLPTYNSVYVHESPSDG